MSDEPRTPIGVVRSGPVADVDERAVVTLRGSGRTARLWVSGVDRWRVAESDPTLRRRLVGNAPVVEWAIRVPGGDVSWATYGFVPAGGTDTPAVAMAVRNESSEPVAAALVLGPVGATELRDDALLVDGRVAARFARSPRGLVRAGSPEALAERLTEVAGPGTEPRVDDTGVGAWVAAVAPVAHGAGLDVVVGEGDAWGAAFPVPPAATQVAAGWATHASRGLHLTPADENDARSWQRATTALALVASAVEPADVSAVGAAVARMGWREEAVDLARRAIGARRRDGSVGEGVADTIDAIDLWASTIGLDLTPEGIEAMLLPMAAAVGWLARGRVRRSFDPATARRASEAIERAAVAMARVGEERAATDLRGTAVSLRGAAGDTPAPGPRRLSSTELEAADPATLARWIVATIDAHLRCTADGLEVLAGWEPSEAGASVDVQGAETPWGRAGFAVRWHGRRPALLWEAELAPGLDAFRWTSPRLDPSWSTSDPVGETLLAEPEGLDHLDLVETDVEVLGERPPADGPAPGESFA